MIVTTTGCALLSYPADDGTDPDGGVQPEERTMSSPYDEFFETYRACFGPLHTVRTRHTPEEMVVGAVPGSDGWVEWQMIPCQADLRPLYAELAKACGVPALPSSFLRWYWSRCTLDMDVSAVRLPANPSNDPGGPLREQVLGCGRHWTPPLEPGLIPFGDEAMMDAGPLCFDARRKGDPDGWPVRYWDHEWAGSEREVGPIIFSSFDALAAGCVAYMRRFLVVQQAAPDDEDSWLDRRGECLEALMKADPAGAGGPGREYWQSWVE